MSSIYQNLIEKKESLAVVGLGYVGLPIALEFARNIEQTIEHPAECTMESLMKAIVERQGRINDAMGPAKCTLQMDKQGDSKDGKKRVTNPQQRIRHSRMA